MTQEVERIRARADWLEQQQARYIELANKPYHECTEAENREALELERWVDGGFTLTSVRTLLAALDAQAAVIEAARAVAADVTAANWYEDAFTYIVDAEKLERLRDALDALEGDGPAGA